MTYRLDNSWTPDPAPAGTLTITLTNLSGGDLTGFRLSYTSITRVVPGAPAPENAVFLRRNANYHQFAPPEGLVIPPGGQWRFRASGLNRSPFHRGDGVKTAYLTLADGRYVDVAVGDLALEAGPLTPPPPRLPEGRLVEPYALIPWPEALSLTPGETPLALTPAPGTAPEDLRALVAADALHHRLFGAARRALALVPVRGARAVGFAQAAMAPGAYHLAFGNGITLTHGDADGRRHGLIALLHLWHGATGAPETFRFPATGEITDVPRHGWRGCHLDVSRQFWPAADVRRFLDILAWYRLNVFHWHLTDDEAWRLEIRAFPTLTTVGATRGPDAALLPQLGNGATPVSGHYSQEEVRAVVAHATALGIAVVPEIDMPGHSTAMLAALPELIDPDEPAEYYFPVQGFPNNALNPGIERTYEVLEVIFDELAELFPSPHVHIGGDEVAKGSWLESPRARVLMQREGLAGTFELQSHFLRRVKGMLEARGKVLVGWNEVAHGGGVPPERSLLMAWENPEVGIALAREGYDVVMTPGQAYYLDMVQAPDWLEAGAGWAGPVTPEQSYRYEAASAFPPDLAHRLKGVQACIWCEHFVSRDYFNDLVFPRLAGVAEAAWTRPERKDWDRYAVQARWHPRF